MPGTTTIPDIELIIEDISGGGGSLPPAGGAGGGDEGKRGGGKNPTPARYFTGVAIGIVSITMFFMALAATFLVFKASAHGWRPVRVPFLMWLNTAVLLASSATLEAARKRLAKGNSAGFRRLWNATIVLGALFLAGQVLAWTQLARQGIYLSTNQASSFFYIFTGAHALHLLAGLTALVYVAWRRFDRTKVTQAVAAEVTSYYWHFMGALWVFLLALLYLGK